MNRFQCLACGGSYFDESADGIPFAHVCGPLPATKKLSERERPNKRDENYVADRNGRLFGIRSEGAGVKCLTDENLAEPGWISALYKHIADREKKENA